jgi:hypothetical protein
VSVQSALSQLGELRTTCEADFNDLLGPPLAFRTLFTGRRLCEWRTGRFNVQSVAVLFDQSEQFVDIAGVCNVRLPSSAASAVAHQRDAFAEGGRIALNLFAG